MLVGNYAKLIHSAVRKALISLMSDQNLNVRIKACWALSSLLDSLTKLQRFPDYVVSRSFFEIFLKACEDNEKVRINSLRALANLIRIFRIHAKQSDNDNSNTAESINLVQVCDETISCLLVNLKGPTSVKVR